MPQHAQHSPSSAHRWLNCPGSIRQTADIPSKSGVHAQVGTAAHKLGEICLQRGVDAKLFLGTTVEGIKVDTDMVLGVQTYLNYVRPFLENASFEIEYRFDLDALNPPVPMFGTSDLVAYNVEEGVLHVFDYKNGYNLVEVEDNPQLQYYGLGGLLWALDSGVKPTRVTLHVIQPNAAHPDGPCRSWERTWNEMVAFKRELFAGVERSLEEDAPLCVGPWCRWCPAAALCPAQHKHALTVAQDEFGGVPAPTDMTRAQLVEVLEKAPIVEAWFNSVRAFAQELLEDGVEVPGWKLVEKRATRKWSDEDETEAFLKSKRVPKREYLVTKLVSPAQAEKIFKNRGMKLKEAKELVAPLVIKESSGYTLAPEKDPRPAQVKAVDEFDALPAPSDSNDTPAEE